MGNFGTVPRGTYGKLCPKPPPVLTPRVHMEPIVGAAVPRRSAEPPSPCSSKDGPSGLSLRNLSNFASFSAASASFSFCLLSKLTLKAVSPAAPSPSQLSEPQSPPIQTLHSRLLSQPSSLSQLYSPRSFRPLRLRMLAIRLSTAFPVYKICTSPLGPT